MIHLTKFHCPQATKFWLGTVSVKHVICSFRLQLKQNSLKALPNKKDSSEEGETLSHDAFYYCLLREIDRKGVEHSWAEL
jgi:hypothetical protein